MDLFDLLIVQQLGFGQQVPETDNWILNGFPVVNFFL